MVTRRADDPVNPNAWRADDPDTFANKKTADKTSKTAAAKAKEEKDLDDRFYENESERKFKAKQAAAKKSAAGKKKPEAMNVGGGGQLAGLRNAPRGKVDLADERVDVPASKRPRVGLDTRKTESASASAPKKRGKLRRAASAVGRGFRKAFSGGSSKSSQARGKSTDGGLKKGYRKVYV